MPSEPDPTGSSSGLLAGCASRRRVSGSGCAKEACSSPAAAEPASPDLRGRGPGPPFRGPRIGRCLSHPLAPATTKKSLQARTAAPEPFPTAATERGVLVGFVWVAHRARACQDVGRSGRSARQGARWALRDREGAAANGYVDRPLLPSGRARLVEDVTGLGSHRHASGNRFGDRALRAPDVVATEALATRSWARPPVMRDETGWFTAVGAGYPGCGTTGVCLGGRWAGPRTVAPQR